MFRANPVVDPVQSTQGAAAAAPVRTASSAPRSSFAAAFATASAPTPASDAATAPTAGAPTAPASGAPTAPVTGEEAPTSEQARLDELRRRLDVPRGERWEPVPGRRDYADIVSGPRNGFYVNLRPGPRQGEVFHIIRRDGRELHVYGSGRDREIVEVRRPSRAPDPSSVRPREGETFVPVEGRSRYQRIEGGARDDLYINLSGNERTGRAFRIVERDGQRFHVYGSGRERIEVPVGGGQRTREAEGGTGAGGDPTAPASGGAPTDD